MEKTTTLCDLCGKEDSFRMRKYTFYVGQEFDGYDGYDRYYGAFEDIVLCRKCQARLVKALHGKGNIKSVMYGEFPPSNARSAVKQTKGEVK